MKKEMCVEIFEILQNPKKPNKNLLDLFERKASKCVNCFVQEQEIIRDHVDKKLSSIIFR